LPKRNTIFAALVIAGVFLAFAGDGLRAYFTPDDMMNLYGAWFRHLAESDRPVGALFYRTLFTAFGFNPLPYRIACFAILSANLAMLYVLCLKLSGSREVAALACLLGAYHAHLADLYYSTGTVFDLLCFLFYFGALALYIQVRERAVWWRILVLALYLCALGAKEMAVTLPLFLALYDLIYYPPAPRFASVLSWAARELRRLWPFALLTAAFILYKTTGPARMTANPDYLPHFSWQVLTANWRHYAFDLFYGAIQFTGLRIVLLWAVVLALVLVLRKRDLLFAACVILLGILPVVLIAERGLYAIYLTLPGWYLLVAQSLTAARRRLLPRAGAAAPAILFLLVAACLVPLHWRQKARGNWWVAEAHESVRRTLQPLRHYDVPRAAKVLVLNDPYPDGDNILLSMFRLTFRDEDIQVRHIKSPSAPPTGDVYDRVFTYANQQLTLVTSRTP
jgi:hypothetical protein